MLGFLKYKEFNQSDITGDIVALTVKLSVKMPLKDGNRPMEWP